MGKLSDRSITTTITGGYLHIILPNGGWSSWRIAVSSLLSDVNSDISSLQAYENQATKTDKVKSQSASFSKALGTDVKLESLDFIHVTGSIDIKVGTSAGTDDVLPTQTLSSGSICNNVPMYFSSSTTLYITITGTGTADFIFNYRQSYNS